MTKWTTKFPCHTQDGWNQSKILVDQAVRQRPEQFDRIRAMAHQITSTVGVLSPALHQICQATCVSCGDVCCERATIWYDIKDLLCLYFSEDPVPKKQIQKTERNGARVCSNLSEKGCVLPRQRRPFVCNWYFCTCQKEYMKSNNPEQGVLLKQCLTDIKRLRNQIALAFGFLVEK